MDLRGSLASVRGLHDEAIKILNEAVEGEQNLGYWEPPHYTRPVMESLADTYSRAGRHDDAIRAYERSLKNRPNSGFALAGIARAYRKAGKGALADDYQRKFAFAWKEADKDVVIEAAR